MTTLTVDTERFEAAGLTYAVADNGDAMFGLPREDGGTDQVRVALAGTTLTFMPQRSSGHRKVLARLGEG